MAEVRTPDTISFEPQAPPARREVPPDERLTMDDLSPVRLLISAQLGTSRLLVRDLLALRQGSVIQLNRVAGELAELQVNGLSFAKGEVVVIGDSLHVRIAEVLGASEVEDESSNS